ncbi:MULTISPECIES: hypothetical protein [unclassified Paenibacillus]|uniref:hypothetical protein n=1 Tax=unclassified Paenibacillus TaxID=185978 RepID=UPI0030F58C48
MDKRVEEIIASLDAFSIEIVVPLRKKVINKTAFSELFGLMSELQKLLTNEKWIQKELVEKLFHIYSNWICRLVMLRRKKLKMNSLLILLK